MSNTYHGYNSDESEDSIKQSPTGLASKPSNTLEDCTAEVSTGSMTHSPNNCRQSARHKPDTHENYIGGANDFIIKSSGRESNSFIEDFTTEVSTDIMTHSPNKCRQSIGDQPNTHDDTSEDHVGDDLPSPCKLERGKSNDTSQEFTDEGFINKSRESSRNLTCTQKYTDKSSMGSIPYSPSKTNGSTRNITSFQEYTEQGSIGSITNSPSKSRDSTMNVTSFQEYTAQSSMGITKSPIKIMEPISNSISCQEYTAQGSMGSITPTKSRGSTRNVTSCQGYLPQNSMGSITNSPCKSKEFMRNLAHCQEYTAQGSMGSITPTKSRGSTRKVTNRPEYTPQSSMGNITNSPSKSRGSTRNVTNSQEYTPQSSMGSILPNKSRGSTGNVTTSDDEMIEGLFYACDEKEEGWVEVSSIVEYLTNTNNSTGPETDDAITRLETLLNPGSLACKMVDMETCRLAIRCWIKEVRNGLGNPSVEEILNSPKNSPRHSKLFAGNESLRAAAPEKVYTASPLVDSLDLSRISLDYSLLETSNRIQEQELSEMLSKIYDLQNQNLELIEENSKLQQHLDVQEENVATMSLDNKNLQKKVQSLQNIMEERNEILSENEELKVKILNLQDTKKHLEDSIIKLEKENTELDTEVKNTENKNGLTLLLSEQRETNIKLREVKLLQQTQIQENDLTLLLSEQRETNIKLREVKLLQQTQIQEKSEKLEKLENYIEELHQMNEDIRADKSGLQQELIQAQHHILSLENGELNPEKEDIDEEDCSISIPPTPTAYYLPTSTPVSSLSIHTQLYRTLGSSPHLPSPLCNKEIADSLRQLDNHSTSSLDEELSSILDSVEHVKNKPTIVTETAKLLSRSREKREEFLREIDDLLNSPPELEKYKADNSSQDLLTRNTQIVEILKVLKEENERLRSLNDQSLESLLNTEKDIDTTYDNRIIVLKDTLIDERKQHQFTASQLKTVEDNLKQKVEEIETKQTYLESLEMIKSQLQEQNEQLKRILCIVYFSVRSLIHYR
ncbi:hypothetical protein LOTGIDRAFT_162864 [Lottia gigantea]|uniref:Uncharacterized protein n=1 Tax=Lottia gigantea TaxID=225164 RepID=V4BSY9_LOTGI|nr:hypothetical protein LOTGIDRAFT_162864 [Lottia gigantea]ESO92209.1 hypothetical protein LOTGIDRAFT_162864 [Lottia gigantea]